MPGFTYEFVNNYFKENGCKLITNNYKNNKQKLEFIGSCGHHIESNFIKAYNCKILKCKDCNKNFKFTLKKYNSKNKKYNKIPYEERIRPETFSKMCQRMERLYYMTHKYRSDFLPENYDKTLTCWNCKETKSMRLFPYRKQYKDNKEKRCKLCNRKNHSSRRDNHTEEQFITSLVTSTRNLAKRRKNKGRHLCAQHSITTDDIMELYKKQNGICVFSGRKMELKSHLNNSTSIDRIDSDKGYTKDNIQLVIWCINQAKNNITDNEFRDLINDCYKHQNKQ
jgi:hypothetical protein